jgi:hypothetical protein
MQLGRLASLLNHGSVFVFYNQYKSAMTTFDILRNYASLSEKSLEDQEDNIDDPANGFLLGSDAHTGLDKFKWCLLETQVGHISSCSLVLM